MDNRNKKRKLLGAVAGAIAKEDTIKYAQDKGLFVLMQSGDAVKIATLDDFKPREW
jgi:hypothetical protein